MKTNNSIINVTINGMTAMEAIGDIKLRLESVERSAFNIALECAYVLGVTIPAYTDSEGIEHGEATIDKPIKKQADLLKLIGKSKATLSRWIKAVKLIIEQGYFTEFYTGSLPFSFDKIIVILENGEKFTGYTFADLMSMTVDSLEAMVDTAKEEQDSNKADGEADGEAENVEESPKEVEYAVFSYNDKEYKVVKADFEKWLDENAIIA